MLAQLAAPFAHWKVQYVHDAFGYAFWCEGATIVTQMGIDVGSEAGAIAYHRFERAMLERHAAEIERAGGLYVIHDWRRMARHESAARTYWQAQIRERPRGYLQGSTVVVNKVAPLLKMAVQAVNLVSSITGNGTVELVDDIDDVVRRRRPIPVADADIRLL